MGVGYRNFFFLSNTLTIREAIDYIKEFEFSKEQVLFEFKETILFKFLLFHLEIS